MTIPETMRVLEITRPGGPEVLKIATRPVPRPKQGELLVKVAAAGVNRPDTMQRAGNYPVPPGASDIPGLELAGSIAAIGESVARWRVGDRVTALVQGGGYAEYCTAPAPQCLPIPKGMTPVEAASLPETFFTVWSNVFDRAAIKPGESFLVQGGSSGILRRRLTVTGSALRPRPVEFKGAIARNLREKVWPLIEAGRIKAVVYKTFPLAEAAKAHELMESSAHIGKIVLTV